MIPRYSRVVAIDDDEDHLKAITWGLSLAGFCPIPLRFDDGELADPPSSAVPGVRTVFTDIHMVGGSHTNMKVHSGNIIRCLRAIVGKGPYALIFWSMHPSDVAQMQALIEADGPGAELNTPVGYGSIDKRHALVAGDPGAAEGATGAFDAEALRTLILEQLKAFPTLATAASWEMRAAEAAAKTNDALFGLTGIQAAPARTAQWEGLLAYLATEAVGQEIAVQDMDAALDSALLPILEDQIGFIGEPQTAAAVESHPLRALLAAQTRPRLPEAISVGRLNASYLIDEAGAASRKGVFERGMVVRLNDGFVSSGELLRRFGIGQIELLQREFLCGNATDAEIQTLLPLHLVELGPECDHVQSKVSTHRYLLSILAPASLLERCQRRHKGKTISYHNDSIVDVGRVAFSGAPTDDFHLLVSTRCFMSLPPATSLDGQCRFRLRRMSMEEVMHRYTSHARRPGVMKF